MFQVKFGNNSKKFDALNFYMQEVYTNGVSRPSLSIEFDGDLNDFVELYNEWDSIGNTGLVTVNNEYTEDTFDGYIIPISFRIENKEIERETLTTVQVLQKVITFVVATKTAAELKSEPTYDALAASTAEILDLRRQISILEDLALDLTVDVVR